MPAPVRQLSFTANAVLEPRKLRCIVALTREMIESSNAEAIVRQALSESAALALDAAMFSDTATSAAQPAGLLNDVTPLAGTAGGGANAIARDLVQLGAALAGAGGGRGMVLITSAPNAVALKIFAGAGFASSPVLVSSAIADGVVIAIEAGSFVSGFGAEPEFRVSKASVLHFEDTAPANITTPGVPAAVAAPSRSLWQIDSIALAMTLRAAWGMRAAGHVSWIADAAW
jgi:hypothetical protein